LQRTRAYHLGLLDNPTPTSGHRRAIGSIAICVIIAIGEPPLASFDEDMIAGDLDAGDRL